MFDLNTLAALNAEADQKAAEKKARAAEREKSVGPVEELTAAEKIQPKEYLRRS